MDVFYKAELDFLIRTFEKFRLRVQLLCQSDGPETVKKLDLGLRRLLGMKTEYTVLMEKSLPQVAERVVYKIKDPFQCSYVFLRLPETEEGTILCVGPYLSRSYEKKEIMELAEETSISPKRFRQVETYYKRLPILPDNSPLYTVLDTLCGILWEDGNYSIKDINQEFLVDEEELPPEEVPEDPEDPEQMAWTMQLLEERYAMENEMMWAVSQGLIHKAEAMASQFSSMPMEERLSDPLRNVKNYGIILNTLLRKAAERGGVHPLYLDEISSDFAIRLERSAVMDQCSKLMEEMLKSYCRLVNRHAIQKYSPTIQKAMIQIDSDISGNLSLKALAGLQNLNASYFSALFKKETGQTVTEYITGKRVRLAMQLLATTELQVQTIAQHCGILDVNYFCKVFRRMTGKSPKQYRKEVRMQVAAK